MKITIAALAAAAAWATLPALAQSTKWDLPSGYATNTFQVQNLQWFAQEVDKASGGKL
jgi:TRAP-type C4-dicarboxylate transport system substrate-binding protein